MQRSEKTPWNNDGARQAHVEFHCPVPRVIPAASNAPILHFELALKGCEPSLSLTNRSR